ASRTESSPLEGLAPVDIETEENALKGQIGRLPIEEELVMYLNHPGDAIKTILFRQEFGNPNFLPLDVWFEGLAPGRELEFKDSDAKPHSMKILGIGRPDTLGMSDVRYTLDGELFAHSIKVSDATGAGQDVIETANKNDPCQIGSPSKGDLWIMYVKPGDVVKKGEELFNITIMKQEKAVLSPMEGVVKRVLKVADYKYDKKMVPVQEGELLVVLGPPMEKCGKCDAPVRDQEFAFCPQCGNAL
ncbi:MAG: pyruvate carboxylase, partial [Desulfobacteraceae bacterium]